MMRPGLISARLSLISAFLVFGCQPAAISCLEGPVRLSQNFSGAPGSACERTGPAEFRLLVRPEDEPINPSPWYAFDLIADQPTRVRIELDYGEYEHRYNPKLKSEDDQWRALDDRLVNIDQTGSLAVLQVEASQQSIRIAGQPVLGVEERASWRQDLAQTFNLETQVIGQSLEGRPIEALIRTSTLENAPLIVIIGGQHPPEVPGTLGLRTFLETLFTSSEYQSDLSRFEWLIIPDLNPDGIYHGHWRHNLGHVDLNRDWGPFTQPETEAVANVITQLIEQGHSPFLMLDFHATRRDVLYTPPDEQGLSPGNFAADWISSMESISDRSEPLFDRNSSHNPDLPTSKIWFAQTYQAPGITVEFGDETDSERIDRLAETAAMALLIELASNSENINK